MSRMTFLALFAAIAASGCAVNPATGKNQLMLVSEDQEIAMGRQADSAVVTSIGLYPDAVWQRYIQQFGERVHRFVVHDPERPGKAGAWTTKR